MYRKCATEVSVLHQKQVTESLLELMQKTPYEEISVTQLCQAAGVSRRVFYHLFSNKTGALHALLDNKLLEMESSETSFSAAMLRFFQYWKQQKALLDALNKNAMAGLLQERLIDRVLTEDYDIRYWLHAKGWSQNSKAVIIYGLCGLMGLMYSWYYSGYPESPEEMALLVEKIHPF